MPSRDGCLYAGLDEPALIRMVDPLRWCGCSRCKRVKAGTWYGLGCECAACAAALAQFRSLWAAARHVNHCDCCGAGWVAHSRANVCPKCWDKNVCRVCWQRPGVVCAVCAEHLATPYSEAT